MAAQTTTVPGSYVGSVRCRVVAQFEPALDGPVAREGDRWRFASVHRTGSGSRPSFREIETNVEKVVRGKHGEIRLALVALIAEGHLLIEDVPGVGKTMLAKALARSIDCSFRRIQFTPDLLPTDVTGVNVFNQEQRDFEFQPGAIFANIVLGDEINRASPKTQSALLECMEERQVTVDTETHPLGTPFMVIATQNPIEHEGTYPLPEAQLDRFMMRLSIGYPVGGGRGRDPGQPHQRRTARRHRAGHRRAGRGRDDRTGAAGARRTGDPSVHRRVVEATRRHGDIYLGASPRAGLCSCGPLVPWPPPRSATS